MNQQPLRKHKLTNSQRRSVIVEAALKLFAERGFRGTTTRQLASAAGISEPVLYQHFETKQDLYSAIIETKSLEKRTKVMSLLGPYLDTHDDSSFFTKLAALILEPYTTDWDYIRLMLFSALEGHEFADLLYERQAHCCFFRMITDYIERRIEQRAFRKVDPVLAARCFVGMVSNVGITSVLFPRHRLRLSKAKIIQGLVNIFLQGVVLPNEKRNHE